MVERSNTGRLCRRTFVVRTGLLALGTLGVSLMDACAPAAPSAPAAARSAGGAVKLPTYLPFEGPKPNLAGNPQGLDPAYFKFPTDLVKTVPAFVKSRCTDLTPYLSGDAIKDYPNLAHYTSYTWRSGVVENKIYAIPIARPPIGTVMMYRADLLEKAGVPIDKTPHNADDFKRILQAVARPQDNQWALPPRRPRISG